MIEIGLIKSPWQEKFLQLISVVERDLLLVSPFIKVGPADQITSTLKKRGLDREVHITVLTNLRPESTLNGSLDLEALVNLSNDLPTLN